MLNMPPQLAQVRGPFYLPMETRTPLDWVSRASVAGSMQ